MRVIYQCYGRAHTSIVAAHLHLGNISSTGQPSVASLKALPYFDQARPDDLGRPLRLGMDETGHEVYSLGLGAATRACLGVLHSVLDRAGRPEEIIIVGTLEGLGLLARIGGGLSRELGLVTLGRPLAAYGVRQDFPNLVRIVGAVKDFLREASL